MYFKVRRKIQGFAFMQMDVELRSERLPAGSEGWIGGGSARKEPECKELC